MSTYFNLHSVHSVHFVHCRLRWLCQLRRLSSLTRISNFPTSKKKKTGLTNGRLGSGLNYPSVSRAYLEEIAHSFAEERARFLGRRPCDGLKIIRVLAQDLYPALGWRHLGSAHISLTALPKSVQGSWVDAWMCLQRALQNSPDT